MLKRMAALLIIILIALFGAGCLAPSEIDAYGYVISLGVDPGNDKRFCFTFMLQRESGETASSGEGGAIILAEEGDDLYEALNSLEGRIPYALDMSRMNFFLFGAEAARMGLIEEIAMTELEHLLVRSSAVVMICEPSASRFIGGMSANNEANITKLQSAILQDKENTGMVSVITLSRMMEACTERRFDICPALGGYDPNIITDMSQKKSEEEGEDPTEKAKAGERVGGLKSSAVGSALFDGWIMKDTLTRRETMLLNIAVGEFKLGTYSVETENGLCPIKLFSLKQSIRAVSVGENGAEFSISVTLRAEPLKRSEVIDKTEARRIVEEAQKRITCELCELFSKCRSASSDAFGLGTELSKRFRSPEEWEAYDWKSKYPSSAVIFDVELEYADGGDR